MKRDYSTVHSGSRPYNSTEPSGFEEMCRHGWPTCPTCDALYNDWRWHLGRAWWLIRKEFVQRGSDR